VPLPTFILIHGFAHNAASWTPLVEALARRGAPAIAIDLPCDDPKAGLREYADAVLSKTALVEDAAIVAHSMGGLTGPIVAGERRCRELVMLCTALGKIGATVMDDLENDPEAMSQWARDNAYSLEVEADGLFPAIPDEFAKAAYYQHCEPALQAWAVSQLRRQGPRPLTEVWPLERWPDVPVRAFYAEDDRAVSTPWSIRVLRERYGVEAQLIPGDHSPFLARPDELAELLLAPYASAR
jgi:pimeloyl-ACP methyl ester carboxylesterase